MSRVFLKWSRPVCLAALAACVLVASSWRAPSQLPIPPPSTWTNFAFQSPFHEIPGGIWQYPQYRRLGDVVYLRGACEKDTIFGVNDVITILPAGYCPPALVSFITFSPGGALGPGIVIYADGRVTIDQPIQPGFQDVDLSGVFFSITP